MRNTQSDHMETGGVRARRRLAGCAALLLILLAGPAPRAQAAAAVPPGVWLMGTKVAIQIFDCRGMLCGRVIWLTAPLNPEGLLKRDKLNPDPALRQRQGPHGSRPRQRICPHRVDLRFGGSQRTAPATPWR